VTTLADFDTINDADVSLAGITPELYRSLPAPWLPAGFHTVVFPDGSHRTFRVRLDRQGAFSGRRTLALLIGPVNTDEYQTVGLVMSDGFALWKAHRAGKVAEHAAILWRLAKGEEIDGYELLTSKRCRICLRELTTPESVRLELGPTCAKKVGAA
jgi:hypothetical protein